MDIQEYRNQLLLDVRARAADNFTEAAFTEMMCEKLAEQAVIGDCEYVGYRNTVGGLRVDAYSHDPDTGLLSLCVTDFSGEREASTVTLTDAKKTVKRAVKFFEKCRTPNFTRELEESHPVFDLADSISRGAAKGGMGVKKLQVVMLTDSPLSERITEIRGDDDTGLPVTYNLWDLGRLHALESSSMGREDIVVDLAQDHGGPLPCLDAGGNAGTCRTYLTVIPGNLLANLYDRYGDRLLEQNVRTFLQFRGKVNKGIRNTIKNEPSMFMAYNNGVTATADHLEIRDGGLCRITNLQIVNGGQTSAAIFNTRRESVSLDGVFVQAKISVINPADAEEVVPKISEYANTQNKVNAADFFSNHPFHRRMEEFSRRLLAPSPRSAVAIRDSKWYYERTRGQYANAQSKLSAAQCKSFMAEFPKAQMFTKTDLAKYEMSFMARPHDVSLGAQKVFGIFAEKIGSEWGKSDSRFNELYFKTMVAKAIIFRDLDKAVMGQPWYHGYKANIITYAIAKLVTLVESEDKALNLESVWDSQETPPELLRSLLNIAEIVNTVIKNSAGQANISEYCKKETCWNLIRDMQIMYDTAIADMLMLADEKLDAEKLAKKDQRELDKMQIYKAVMEKQASGYWQMMTDWCAANSMGMIPKERGILKIAVNPVGMLSEKQALVLHDLESRALAEGMPSNS